ncbi:MAG: hypothetical protein M0Q42_03965 [Xanthomonadales bacterium]|nr:hypothetical protein [Xanthomonadales bacterium]
MKCTRLALICLVLSTVALAACKRDQPATESAAPPAMAPAPAQAPAAPAAPEPVVMGISVTEVQPARIPDGNAESAEPTDVFSPQDELAVLVFTDGAGEAELSAGWTYVNGDEHIDVHSESHTIQTDGPAIHQFRINKPDGFPAGAYQVEILLDGVPAMTRDLTVQ